MRLDVLLARNAGWSRTAARGVIAEGRVRIADEVVEDPRHDIPERALPFVVTVDDAELPLYDRVSLMLNKPTGCVTALRDPQHPTAYALLREAPLFGELRPAGRLDLDSSGLLLWSTDGGEIQRLTHPKRAVPRTYQAVLARPFAPLPEKLVLDDGHEPNVTALVTLGREAAHPSLQIPSDSAALAAITIVGGAYHEVRRIFAALGSHVLGLCRVQFGDLELPRDLAPGEYRLLPNEVR
ncbi:MAG TPA: pseudouridine synthase [Polyangia bacterium]